MHTKGKLEQRGTIILFADNAGGFDIYECPSPQANARRLVACWNACEGISTENLESRDVTLMTGERQRRRDTDLSTAEALLRELEEGYRLRCNYCVGDRTICATGPGSCRSKSARVFLSRSK